jgi:hypothetical protein
MLANPAWDLLAGREREFHMVARLSASDTVKRRQGVMSVQQETAA